MLAEIGAECLPVTARAVDAVIGRQATHRDPHGWSGSARARQSLPG